MKFSSSWVGSVRNSIVFRSALTTSGIYFTISADFILVLRLSKILKGTPGRLRSTLTATKCLMMKHSMRFEGLTHD